MVSNLINDNGNAARNQFVINEKNGKTVFQSYNTRVAYRKGNKVCIHPDALGPRDSYSPSSNTTRKHLYIYNPLGKRGGFLRGKKLKDSYRAFLEQFNLEDWEMQKCIDFLAYRYYSEWGCYIYFVDNQFEGIIAFADWQ